MACPSQFLCTQQNAQCAALADFYCATNGWLWAQGPVQGMGWSAAAGCYASLPAFGCVAAVPPVPTDYCTFSGVSCAEDGTTITALNLTAQGTTSATISVTNPVAQLSRSWGSSQYGSHYGRGWPYTGTYIPTDEFPIVTPSDDPFSCSQYGGVAEFNDVTGVFDCWQFTSVDLNASGIDGPWYCPSYLSGGSSAPYVSSTSSPGAAWNFSFGAVLYVTNPNQVPGGWVSCQVGLANNTVYTTGRETATCFGCYMYGSLPASIGNLTGLTALILNTNLLFGALPDSIGRLTNLMDLEVAGNQLTGPLPSSLGSLTSLTSLDLNNNAITGTIPDLGNLSNLTYLMLASNQLAGSFPESLCRLFSQIWTFAQGEFSPAPIGILLTNNLLSGTLPDCIGNMSGLLLLDLGYNRLTGSIPESIGNLSGYVAPQPLRLPPPTPPHWPPYPTAPSAPDAPLIDLGQTTTTDEMLLGIIGLGYLALNNNQLSGTIPSSIGSLSYLHHLDLSSNQLTGNVPDSLQWLVSGANCVLAPELSILMAFMSMTLGTAAPPWCFTSLQLDSNRLTGTIPAWLGSFGAPFGPLGPGSDGSVINLNGSPKTLSLTSNLFSGLGDPSMFMGSQFTGFVNTSSPSGSGQTATMYVGPTVTQLPGACCVVLCCAVLGAACIVTHEEPRRPVVVRLSAWLLEVRARRPGERHQRLSCSSLFAVHPGVRRSRDGHRDVRLLPGQPVCRRRRHSLPAVSPECRVPPWCAVALQLQLHVWLHSVVRARRHLHLRAVRRGHKPQLQLDRQQQLHPVSRGDLLRRWGIAVRELSSGVLQQRRQYRLCSLSCGNGAQCKLELVLELCDRIRCCCRRCRGL